jgi:hypothetical protein
MKFDTDADLLRWIVKNWHYMPNDPLAEIILDHLEPDRKKVKAKSNAELELEAVGVDQDK